MISNEKLILRERLRVLQEKKKLLEEIKLENEVDVSNDKCYIIVTAQISLLKNLIREFENVNKRSGIFGQKSEF